MSIEVKGYYIKPHRMPTSILRSHRGRYPLVYGSQDVALRPRIGGFFDLGAMMCGPLGSGMSVTTYSEISEGAINAAARKWGHF